MQRYKNLSIRDVHGILLLDKPSGFSSSFLSKKIKKLFYAKKVGHAGTLDPLATGMLPICLGKATKFAKYLLQSDKQYRVLAKLGESTDTFDSTGVVIGVFPVKFDEQKLKQCLDSFIGQSYQFPPMFSALKYHGIPLYKYARKGISIPIKSRTIYIYDLSVISIRSGNIIELNIQCSKGTYIRSVINDIGKFLGCGAHVIGLRRLMIGKCIKESMINIKILESIFYNNLLNDLETLNRLDKFLISGNVLNNFIN